MTIDYRLLSLVLALVARQTSMEALLASGFTIGQVMRALVEARDLGYIAVTEKSAALTESGTQHIADLRLARDRYHWIVPMESSQIEKIELNEVYLPISATDLD